MNPKRIATETLAAFETGSYLSPEGGNVEPSALLGECLEGTREYQPEQLADLLSRLPHPSSPGLATTFSERGVSAHCRLEFRVGAETRWRLPRRRSGTRRKFGEKLSTLSEFTPLPRLLCLPSLPGHVPLLGSHDLQPALSGGAR
jgi:hypothetical protein